MPVSTKRDNLINVYQNPFIVMKPKALGSLLAFAFALSALAWHGPGQPPNEYETCLDLPGVPFNYADIQLPNHLQLPNVQDTDNTPAGNPITDAGATLGRVLFYDTRLSANQAVACASCHKQEIAFTDDVPLSLGFEGGLTGRNSMSLAMARYYQNGRFFWDERAATLEEQTLMPIQDHTEMGLTLEELESRLANTEYYPLLFEEAFGSPEITSGKVALALAQFVRSMVSYQSRYDMARQTAPPGPPGAAPWPAFTAEENLGKALFFDANRGNCAACHGTEAFIAPGPRNNGLDLVSQDEGLGGVTGNPQQIGLFKTPSLRNVALTAPFMHDGRFEGLEEVIQHYSNGIQPHPNLSPQLRIGGPAGPPRRPNFSPAERQALVAFLETLTDEAFLTDERWANPFCETTVGTTTPASQSGWAVFPNPATDWIHLRLDSPSGQEHQLLLFNANGQVLRTYSFSGNQFSLQRDGLPAGLYHLQLISQEGQWIKPLVIH